MKAFPVILGLVALLTICSVDAAPFRAPPEYYTVMNGSQVALKCDYGQENPNQVLWVHVKSLRVDGALADTIGSVLDLDLESGYRIESDNQSSSLIMEEVTVDGSNRGRPGLYKCAIDFFQHTNFHVSVVENDFFCRRVGAAEGTTDDDAFPAYTFLDVECGITKDREPFGVLEFALSVGNDVVQTVDVYGVLLQMSNASIATARFRLLLRGSYYGQSVHVSLKLNTFTPEVGETALKFVVAERLLIGPYREEENQDVADKDQDREQDQNVAKRGYSSWPTRWTWLHIGVGASMGICVGWMWMNR